MAADESTLRRGLACIAKFVERSVRLRFPLFALLFLGGWTLFAGGVPAVRPLLGNLLLVENLWQILFFACANFIAVVSSLALIRRIGVFDSPQERLRVSPWGWKLWLLAIVVSAAAPIGVFSYSFLETPPPAAPATASTFGTPERSHAMFAIADASPTLAALFIAGGYLTAVVVLFGIGWLRCWLLGGEREEENYFPFQAMTREGKLGRRLPVWLAGAKGDLELAAYLICLAVVFFVLRLREKQFEFVFLSIPTYVVLLVLGAMMVGAFLACWLDRARVPVFILFVVHVLTVNMFGGRPATLPLLPVVATSGQADVIPRATRATSDEPASDEPANASPSDKQAWDAHKREIWKAVEERMRQLPSRSPPAGRSLVVVTCPGGGIHAAAWCAYVLEALDRRYSDFSDSIFLISGVSGGSVGSMFYVNSRVATPRTKQLDGRQWRRAADSSLEAIGAGLAFDDGPGILLPMLKRTDRGVQLENAWRSRLEGDKARQTLDAWGRQALRGEMPVVVFNATDAASGRRILFSSVATPPRETLAGRVARPWDHRELFDFRKFDMHVATAARASATFPYVSPFTRPSEPNDIGRTVGIGDGGYIDNEGVVTAIDWIDFLWRHSAEQELREGAGRELERGASARPAPFQRIVLLRIQPNSDADPQGPPDPKTLQSNLRWLAGPLESLVSMRTTSQIERGQLEVDLASANLGARGATHGTTPSSVPPTGVVVAKSATPLSAPPSQVQIYQRATNAAADLLQKAQSIKRPSFSRSRPESPSSRERSSAAPGGKSFDQKTPSPPPTSDGPATTRPSERPPSRAISPETFGRASGRSIGGAPGRSLDGSPDAPAGESEDWRDQKVLILPLPFTPAERDQSQPLNWKLSERQKSCYELAWKMLLPPDKDAVANDAATGDKQPPRCNFLRELDSLFQLRPPTPDP